MKKPVPHKTESSAAKQPTDKDAGSGDAVSVPPELAYLLRPIAVERGGRQKYAPAPPRDTERDKRVMALVRAQHIRSAIVVLIEELKSPETPPERLASFYDLLANLAPMFEGTATDSAVRMNLAACIADAIDSYPHRPEHAPPDTLEARAHRRFGFVFPHYAALLNLGDLRDVIEVWKESKKGRPKKGQKVRNKWTAIRKLCDGMGLPPVSEATLEREWHRWIEKNS